MHLTNKKYFLNTMKMSGGGVWRQLVMYRMDNAGYKILTENFGYHFLPDTGYRI